MTEAGEAAEAAPARLAAARTARGLSTAQVAEQMRIAPEAVRAMEEGRYADLGPAVFARGHLRKYASLLGLPVDEVLADYDASPSHAAESTLIPPASAHTPVGKGDRPAMMRAAALVVALAVLAAAAAAGWWYWQSRGGPVEQAAVTMPGMPGSTDEMPEAAPAAAPGSDEASPPPARDDISPDGATNGRLALEFSGPCWVEVYDAEGRRLAFQLAEAGSVLAFDGPAPWRVVLGNADSVRLALDGAGLEIPAGMKVREAALVTIAGDGSIEPAPADEASP